MLISVLCSCDEGVCCVEYNSFEVFVAVCGALTGECQAGNAAGVTGLFGGLCIAPNDGWYLLEKCFTGGLGNGLREECLKYVCYPSSLPTGKEMQAVCCRGKCR